MAGLIDPSKYTFGDPTHQMAADSHIASHPSSECRNYPACPFGATEREHRLFLAQVMRSAEAYWTRLTTEHGYKASDEPTSIAGRFEDFIGYMMNWPEEGPLAEGMADLYTREGYEVSRNYWPVIVTPDQVKDQPEFPAEAVTSVLDN